MQTGGAETASDTTSGWHILAGLLLPAPRGLPLRAWCTARETTRLRSSMEDLDGFGIAVVREEGRWKCTPLTGDALTSLRSRRRNCSSFAAPLPCSVCSTSTRSSSSSSARARGHPLLISDATAAIDYDVAADVLDALNVEIPDIDPDELDDVEPWGRATSACSPTWACRRGARCDSRRDRPVPGRAADDDRAALRFESELSAALDKLPR